MNFTKLIKTSFLLGLVAFGADVFAQCTVNYSFFGSRTVTVDYSISSTNPSCATVDDGTVSVTNASGTTFLTAPQNAVQTYSWSNGATTQNLTGLAAGTYTVTITTVFNRPFSGTTYTCVKVKSATLTAGSCCLSLNLTSTFDCAGAGNGTATVNANDGVANYTYAWSNGSNSGSTSATSNTISGLSAGTYTVTVTDNNCSRVGTVIVASNSGSSIIAIVPVNPSCPGTSDGSSIAVSFGGNAGIMDYDWTGPNGYTNSGSINHTILSSYTIQNLFAGAYNLTITDAVGCTATGSTTLVDPTALVSNAVVTNPSCFGFDDGSVVAEATGGTPDFFGRYLYAWSTGDNANTGASVSIDDLVDGTYGLTITDNNGCTLVESYNVDEPDTMIVYGRPSVFGNYNLPVQGSTAGSIQTYVSGGNGGHTYSWMGPGSPTGAWPTGLGAGKYVVTVTDPKGCEAVGGVFNLIEP